MRTLDATAHLPETLRLTPHFPHLRKADNARTISCMAQVTHDALTFLFPPQQQD